MFNQPLKTTKTKHFKNWAYYLEIYPNLICGHAYDLKKDDNFFKTKFIDYTKKEIIEMMKEKIISRKKKTQ